MVEGPQTEAVDGSNGSGSGPVNHELIYAKQVNKLLVRGSISHPLSASEGLELTSALYVVQLARRTVPRACTPAQTGPRSKGGQSIKSGPPHPEVNSQEIITQVPQMLPLLNTSGVLSR